MRKIKAFTLIELLIVVVIIGILATFVVVSLNGAQKKARNTKAIDAVSKVKGSLETYYGLSGNFALLLGSSGCSAGNANGTTAKSCSAILEEAGATGFTTEPVDAKGDAVKLKVDNTTGSFDVQGLMADSPSSGTKKCWYYSKVVDAGGVVTVTQNLDSATPGTDTVCPI